MASVKTVSVEDLTCPVCCEIYKDPVVLSCSHSICKECIQLFWRLRNTQECPVCRRRSSRDDPLCNLVLKNLCESLTAAERASGSELVCSLHNEKLKLFCLDDEQPVCLVCRDSQKHTNHRFRPIDEVVPSYREQLKTTLKSLEEKYKHKEKSKEECDKTVQQLKTQRESTERQIKEEFKKLHQFLQDEEEALVSALTKEEEQKSEMMNNRIEEMNRQISALADTIKDMKEKMNASDASFLLSFKGIMERAQSSQQDPQMISGALINVADHLRNLTFRVWKKMQQLVHNTVVTLDPSTAHPNLTVSDDLTSLTYNWLPKDPDLMSPIPCVLGSDGFNSGTHCWDVEVGDNYCWSVGITTAPKQRKKYNFLDTDFWCVEYVVGGFISPISKETCFTIKTKLQMVRVLLDWEQGKVTFSYSTRNTPLCSFTSRFKKTLFPFFYTNCSNSALRILPVK
ncbi:nuclear factor 7, brain [Danio aesculapii]|uniref:nuclear factor 7, brain n=1 Tax=Danio aesculapii TaxID=1142201 RepID=UPI0024C0CB7B|nr:nuclear factor 7, brain [Danio aesculapii]